MTVREFLTALYSGLHENNLKNLIAGVTPLINLPATERERAAFYLIQAVLTDTLDSWFGNRPLLTSWLQQIEASLTPGLKNVVASLSRGPDDQPRAMADLVKSYLDLHAIFRP